MNDVSSLAAVPILVSFTEKVTAKVTDIKNTSGNTLKFLCQLLMTSQILATSVAYT